MPQHTGSIYSGAGEPSTFPAHTAGSRFPPRIDATQERNCCHSRQVPFNTKYIIFQEKTTAVLGVWLHINFNGEVSSFSCTPEALPPTFCSPPGFHVSVNRLCSLVPSLSPCTKTQTTCCPLSPELQAAKDADSFPHLNFRCLLSKLETSKVLKSKVLSLPKLLVFFSIADTARATQSGPYHRATRQPCLLETEHTELPRLALNPWSSCHFKGSDTTGVHHHIPFLAQGCPWLHLGALSSRSDPWSSSRLSADLPE